MITELHIKTNIFSSYSNESEEINPGRFGKQLAEYIEKTLNTGGIQIADIYPTDSSYELRIDEFKFKLYIQTGNIDGETDEFLISIEPKKKFVRKLFKKIPTEELINKVYNIIRLAISDNKEIEIIES